MVRDDNFVTSVRTVLLNTRQINGHSDRRTDRQTNTRTRRVHNKTMKASRRVFVTIVTTVALLDPCAILTHSGREKFVNDALLRKTGEFYGNAI